MREVVLGRMLAMAVLLLLGFCIRVPAQSGSEDLLERKVSLDITGGELVYVVSVLAQRHAIPIGLEYSPDDIGCRTLDIELKDGTLREALDSIVQEVPSYRWEIRDGVVHIAPAGNRYPFVALLLDTPVRRFAPAKGLDVFSLRDAIFRIPEVRDQIESWGVVRDRFTDWPAGGVAPPPDNVDLSISNTDVRGVLNKIVRDGPTKIWTIGYSGRRQKAFFITF